MTTQPRPVVAVTPPLPNRRNAELLLLGIAAVITTVALFGAAHVAIRRFAPYADPDRAAPSPASMVLGVWRQMPPAASTSPTTPTTGW